VCGFAHERFAIDQQGRIAAKNATVEPLEIFVRIDAEVVDEEPAQILIDGQGFDLPAAAVQGNHLMRAQTLPPRVRVDPRLDIGQELEMTAAPQIRSVSRLDEVELQLLQPPAGAFVEREVLHVGERFTGPACERGREIGRCLMRIAELERVPRVGRVRLRTREIELVALDLEAVPRGVAHET